MVWNNCPDENYWLDWLNKKPCTTLFVDGNHENHNLLNQMQPVPWNGGFVHQIRPKVLHLMRGQVFNIDGTTFFTMGGADSIDKQYRVPYKSWWPEEMPSDEEYATAIKNLEKSNFAVDYILTHTAPTSIVNQLIPQIKPPDKLTNYLENVKETAQNNNIELTFKNKGQIMKVVMPQLKGKADGKLVNNVVQEMLSNE